MIKNTNPEKKIAPFEQIQRSIRKLNHNSQLIPSIKHRPKDATQEVPLRAACRGREAVRWSASECQGPEQTRGPQ